MKVWLVWTGSYSDASVVGVCSSLELAEATAAMWRDGYVPEKDGHEVDSDVAHVRSGIRRWRVWMDNHGKTYTEREGPPQGQPEVREMDEAFYTYTLIVWCDARDEAHAIKIAADERARFLALGPSTTA